ASVAALIWIAMRYSYYVSPAQSIAVILSLILVGSGLTYQFFLFVRRYPSHTGTLYQRQTIYITTIVLCVVMVPAAWGAYGYLRGVIDSGLNLQDIKFAVLIF